MAKILKWSGGSRAHIIGIFFLFVPFLLEVGPETFVISSLSFTFGVLYILFAHEDYLNRDPSKYGISPSELTLIKIWYLFSSVVLTLIVIAKAIKIVTSVALIGGGNDIITSLSASFALILSGMVTSRCFAITKRVISKPNSTQ